MEARWSSAGDGFGECRSTVGLAGRGALAPKRFGIGKEADEGDEVSGLGAVDVVLGVGDLAHGDVERQEAWFAVPENDSPTRNRDSDSFFERERAPATVRGNGARRADR